MLIIFVFYPNVSPVITIYHIIRFTYPSAYFLSLPLEYKLSETRILSAMFIQMSAMLRTVT